MSNSLDSFLTRIGDVTIERVAPKNNATSPSGDQVIMNSSGSSSNQGVQGGNDEDSEETGGETSDGELERKNLVNSMMRRVDDMNSEGSGDDMDLDETIDTEIGVRMDSERMQHSMSPCGDEDDEDDDVVDAVNILDTLPLEGAPIEGQEVSEADLLGKPLSKDDDSEDISNSQTTSDQEDADPSKRRPDADETDQAKKKQKKDENSEDNESKAEKKLANMRRNIREVMDETQLDEATLSAQRQEMERLRRVQEQQRIIREVQRQIATHRQANKGQLRPVSLLQGRQNDVSTSICQSPSSSSQAKSPNSMMTHGQVQQNQQNLQQPGMKRPMTANRWQKGGRGGCQSQQPIVNKSINKGQMQNVLQQRIRMMTPSVSISPVVPKKEPLEIPYYSDSDLSDAEAEEIDKEISEKMSPPKSPKPQKGKDVVTISSSSEDSDDDCIVLSDPSGGEETDTEDDPANSGMHTNDRYNIPDEHGRVLINVGHPEGEPDVYLAPQVARIIKPHQIGGIRFLFDNIVESIERYKTSSGFGCILAHSMGLGKTLQVASFCDIFFRCTPAKTVLCIMPINTLQNWLAEFNMWLPYEDPNKPNIKKPEEQKLDIKDESCSNQTDMSSLSSRSDARSHQEMPLPPTMMGGGHFPGYENAMGGYYPPTDPMNQNYHHMYPNMNYPPMKQEMEENAMKPPLPYGVPNQGHMYGAPAQMYPPMYPPNPHQNPHQNPPPQNYPNYQNPSQYPNYPPQQQKMPENPPKQDIKTEPQEPKTKEEGTSTNKEENSEEKKEGEKVETPFSVDSPIGLEHRPRHFHLHILNDSHKTMAARARVIKEWQKIGGVLLIGYELYRQLSLKKPNKAKRKRGQPVKDTVDVEEDDKNKGLLEEMHGALVNPGPDLVICDEGHRIKNSHASISLALKQMRTKRRIVLTGYPLQNNLLEYWCMVDFVRPNYLGTKAEFCNMFERPIQNGQCIDSTPQDIRLMRYRAHVLHALLEGFVQRRSHSVLQVSLPRKEEYILLVRMTPHQRKLYDIFMNQVVKTRAVPNPLKAFAVCCKIWNHPDILYHFLRKRQANEEDDLDLEETIEKTTPGGKRPKARGRGEKKGKKVSAFKNRPAASVQPNSLVNENEIENNGEKKNFPALPPPPPGGFANSQQQNFQQNYQEFRPSDQNAYYRNEATGEYSSYYGSNHGGQRFQNQQFPYQQGQNSGFSGQQNYSQNHQGQGFGGEEQQSQNTQKFQNPEFRGEQGSSGNYDAQAMYNRQSYNFQEQRNNYSVPAGQGSNSQGMGQQNLNQQNMNQQNLNQANINQQNLNQPNINQQNINSQNLNQQNLNQQNLNQAPINQQNYQNPLPNQSSVPINDYTNYQHQNQTQSHNYPPNPNQIYRNDNQMNQHNYPPPQEPNSHNNSQQTGFISNQPSGNQSQPLVTNAYSNQPQPSSNYQQNQPQSQVYQQNQSQSFMNNRQVRYQNSQTNFPPPAQAHGFNSERQPYSAAPPANQGQNYNQGQRFPAPQSYQSTNQNESNGQASNYQNSQAQQNHIQSQPNQLQNPQNQMQNSQNLMQNQQNHMQNQQNQMQNQQNQLQNYSTNDTNNWQGNYQNQGSMNQVNQLPQGQNSMSQGQIPQGPNSMAQGQIPQNSMTQGQNSMLQGPNSLTQGPNPIQPPSNPNQMNQAQWDQNQQSRFGTGNYFPQNYPQNSYDYQGNSNPSEMNIKQEENKNIPQNVMRPPNVPNFDNKKDIAMGTQTLPQSNFQGPEANPPRPLQNVNFNTNSTVCKDEDKDKDEIIVEKDKDDKSDDEIILKDEEKDLKCSPSGREDPGIPYDWATELMKGYVPGLIDASAKMTLFFCILEEAIRLGDRVLTFSQSLFTLNLIEDFLARNDFKNPDGTTEKWAKNVNYYRLDGSTTALEREKLINEFNANKRVHLFLVSTRAGSLGINLVGANRAIVFDASWNPCHDTQAVCRVYRYGQKKPCYVYRLVTDNCLERKIYDRQISKQGMADRVVDQCNPDAHLSLKEATTLSWDSEEDSQVQDFSSAKDEYTDEVMHTVLEKHSSLLTKQPFHHESLLVDRKDKKLSQAEKRLARRGYELEKMAANCSRPSYNYIPGNTATRAGGLQIRAIRGGDQGVAQKPVASVRPMQQRGAENLGNRGAVGSRWIPAEVWQRQGMSAQEMTLPLDVVIPTNSPDKSSIVLKAGQRVMVLKSPKGIYMQLESGKIIAIRTALKINQQKREEEPKKAPPAPSPRQQHQPQPQKPEVSFPLRNNSAISIIPKTPNTAATTTTNVPATTPPIPRPLSRPGSASGYRQFSDKDMKRPKPNMMPTPPKMPQVPMHRGFKGKHEMDHSSANENSNSSDSQPRTDQRIEEVRLEDIVGESDANTEYPNNQNRLRNNQEITVEEKTHDFGTDPMTSVKMGVPRVPEPEPVESGAPRGEKKGRPPNFTHRYPPPNIKDDNDEIIIEEANIRQPMPIPHQPPIVPQPIQHPPVQQPQPIPPEIPKMAEQNQTTPVKERAPDNSTDPQHAYPYAQYPRYYDYPDPRSRTTTTPYGYYPGGSQKTEPKPEFSQTPAQPQQANPIEPPPPAPKTEAPAPPAPAPPQPPPPTTSANVPTAFSHPTPARSYAGSYPPYDPYSQHYSAAGGSTPAYPPAGTPGYGAYGTPSYNADYARMYSAFGPPPPPDPYIHRGYAPPPTNHPSNYYTPFSHPPPPPYPNYSFIPGYPNPNIPNESQPPAQ